MMMIIKCLFLVLPSYLPPFLPSCLWNSFFSLFYISSLLCSLSFPFSLSCSSLSSPSLPLFLPSFLPRLNFFFFSSYHMFLLFVPSPHLGDLVLHCYLPLSLRSFLPSFPSTNAWLNGSLTQHWGRGLTFPAMITFYEQSAPQNILCTETHNIKIPIKLSWPKVLTMIFWGEL